MNNRAFSMGIVACGVAAILLGAGIAPATAAPRMVLADHFTYQT